MGFTLILLMPLSILKINLMKAFLEKHCYIAGIVATLSLASPFIKIVNTVYEEGMGGDNYTESYGRLSVADIIIEGIQALYKGVFDRLEVVILASLYIFAAVALVQFFASVSKWHKTMFYTAMYHVMLAPNIYNDVDGQYRGLDQKIHTAQGFNYYTVFSLAPLIILIVAVSGLF